MNEIWVFYGKYQCHFLFHGDNLSCEKPLYIINCILWKWGGILKLEEMFDDVLIVVLYVIPTVNGAEYS